MITNSLRLLKLDDKLQKMLMEGLITTGHAKVLLGVDDKEVQLQIAEKIIDEQLSVRETEQYIRSLNKVKPKKKSLGNVELYQVIEDKLKNKIGTKVKINRKGENKGKIEIEYYSSDDLERIMEIIIE